MGFVNIQAEKLAEANKYANLIRNSRKRQYAFAYIQWLRNGAVGIDPTYDGLSYMAAQAVRLHIDFMNLWEGVV